MTESRSPSPFSASSRTALVATLAASFLGACGGGGSDGSDVSSVPSTTSTVSTGVMTKGSTIVNGVRFEDTSANISIDDTPKTAAALQNGMVVKVVGTVNGDDVNGTAQRIKAWSKRAAGRARSPLRRTRKLWFCTLKSSLSTIRPCIPICPASMPSPPRR